MSCFKKCFDCSCFSCFRVKFKPNEENPLQPLPKPKEADGIDPKQMPEVLIIRNIDPCIKNNGAQHHTIKYDLMSRNTEPQLVVRRGQPFELEIVLNRPYDESKDIVSFIFTVDDEDKPSFGKRTLVGVPLTKTRDESYPWNVVLRSVEDNRIKVQIFTCPESVIGKWRMDIDTKIANGEAYSYCWETGIYLLFNPWSPEDQVYMVDDDWRQESVLADVGLIYRGTFNRIRPCIWKFQQFEKDVLECSLYLIKRVGKINGNYRSDPVVTARALSAAVNSVDDDGAVMGNWSDDFSDGIPPTKWIGSMEILKQYYKKKKPVKYGQCWVFSGVLTTICRAVGIPCRPVTNYKSAHDTQNSLTVDYFTDENGKIMEDMNSDSIWNFHVWNEVWMKRLDLGEDYIGWQVIDATPQEQSDSLYRVGPTSITAVRLGEIKRPYDSGFLFAEVNADKVYWRYKGPTEPLKLLGKDTHGIGKLIITKAPKKWIFDDITQSYKYNESSEEERSTMIKALKQSDNLFARYYLNEDFNDVQFNLETRDDIVIGQPFSVALVMKNVNKDIHYNVSVVINVDAVTYTGKPGKNIKRQRFEVPIPPDTINEIGIDVTYTEYHNKLIDQAAFNVSCLATVLDTEFEYFQQDECRVRKPDVHISLVGTPVQNKEVTVGLHLENPLPVPLKKGEFIADAPGMEKPIVLKMGSSIPTRGKAHATFQFVPTKTGSQTIAAKFISKELQDVDGYLNITVLPNNREDNVNGVM